MGQKEGQTVMVVTSLPAVEGMEIRSLPVQDSKHDPAKSVMAVAGSAIITNASPADEWMDNREGPIREFKYNTRKLSTVVNCFPIVEIMVTTSLPIQDAEYNPSLTVMVFGSPSLPTCTCTLYIWKPAVKMHKQLAE